MDTTRLQLPDVTVDVLTSPIARSEYEATKDDGGHVTAVVSLAFDSLLHLDCDSNLDIIAGSVLADLGGDWSVEHMTVIGADPRTDVTGHLDERPSDSGRILVKVTVHGGDYWPDEDDF